MTADQILRMTDLGVSFSTESGTVDAVRGVSLTVAPGETLALVGESGSGKSLTSLAVMGLLPDTVTATGSVRVGEDAGEVGGREVLGRAEADDAAERVRREARHGELIVQVLR